MENDGKVTTSAAGIFARPKNPLALWPCMTKMKSPDRCIRASRVEPVHNMNTTEKHNRPLVAGFPIVRVSTPAAMGAALFRDELL